MVKKWVVMVALTIILVLGCVYESKYIHSSFSGLINSLETLQIEITENKDEYFKFYTTFGTNIKLGIHEDNQYEDKLIELLRYSTSTSENRLISFKEYIDRVTEKYSTKSNPVFKPFLYK